MSTKNTDYVYQGKVYRLVSEGDNYGQDCPKCAFHPAKHGDDHTPCFDAPRCDIRFFKEVA